MTDSRRFPALMVLAAACGGGMTTEPLLEELPRPLSPAEGKLITSGNAFTFALLRQAGAGLSPGENLFLSPLSASMALGMALNGAGGETFDAMQATLRFDSVPLDDINRGYHDLMELLVALDRRTEMVVANSVWLDEGFPVRPEYVQAVRTWFDAEAQTLDLHGPSALETINGWVARKTANRIPTLLESIKPEEVAFLVNAIYFKGRWRTAFDPERTTPQPFHAADGTVRSVPMMRRDPDPGIRYASTEEYEAAELLYGNGAFAMVIVLPRPGRTPEAVLESLDPASWEALTARFADARVGLLLPRFRLEYKRNLIPDLEALGMEIAFDPGRADFYGIADVRPDRLYISTVLQKTFLEVNEEGTEAAAATAVGIGITSAPPIMTVDRPFIVAIRERLSGTIVFLGLVNTIP